LIMFLSAQLSGKEVVSSVVNSFVALNRTLRFSTAHEETWISTSALVPHVYVPVFSVLHC
jgi:hypothetical protein